MFFYVSASVLFNINLSVQMVLDEALNQFFKVHIIHYTLFTGQLNF